MSMNYKTANRLAELRKKNGYSQEGLAEKLGVSRQAISNWERAEALPDTENLISLATLYGISIDEVVYGDNSKAIEKPQLGKLKPTHTANMKPVRGLFTIVRLVNLIIGASLLGVGLLLVGLAFAFDDSNVRLALLITGGSIALPGLIEIIIGLSFHVAIIKQMGKLNRLKNEGTKFQVDSIELKHMSGFRAGRSTAARLECTYTYQGQTRSVKSKYFITKENQVYGAFIYINPQNSSDYAVEVFSDSAL